MERINPAQSTFDFSGLSPELILDAIESVGIWPQSGLLALNSYENRVYQFLADDGLRYVTKFYRPQRWSEAQLMEEHAFALELAEQEIPLVAPVIVQGETLFNHQGYYFCLYPSVGGRQFEVDNLDHLEWVGRFIGRIHKVAQSKCFSHRASINCQSYLHQPLSILKQSPLIPSSLQTAFFTILEQLISATEPLFIHDQPMRLHGDCHPGNILWRDGPSFVDLDDCRTGPAIQDLWMMLSGDRQQQLMQLDVLAEAYDEFCDFPHQQLTLIEPLRAMRMVHYMAWLAKRWQDPAFPRTFSWFGEDKYWEQQILALKEQLAALVEPPLRLTPQ